MVEKYKNKGLPIVFLLILTVHFLDGRFHFFPDLPLSERRVPAEKPVLDPTFLDPFPSAYEAYYNDHFTWRNHFLKMHSLLSFYAFRKSALPEKVIIGREGWLFKAGFQLDIWRGRFQLSPADLEDVRRELERRKTLVESLGGHYYLAIPPLKATIYPEYLPENVRKVNPQTATEQIIGYLKDHSNIDYIDLITPLKERRAATDTLLYFVTDHHWNETAGLLAAGVIIDHLRRDFPQLSPIRAGDYRIQYVTFNGLTLAQMLGMDQELKEQVPKVEPLFTPSARDSIRNYPAPRGFPFASDYVVDKRTGRPELPALFVNRESFSSSLIPLMAEHFSRSFFLFDNWKHQFHEDIFRQEHPDIYIDMIWEGMIYNLLPQPPAEAGW